MPLTISNTQNNAADSLTDADNCAVTKSLDALLMPTDAQNRGLDALLMPSRQASTDDCDYMPPEIAAEKKEAGERDIEPTAAATSNSKPRRPKKRRKDRMHLDIPTSSPAPESLQEETTRKYPPPLMPAEGVDDDAWDGAV